MPPTAAPRRGSRQIAAIATTSLLALAAACGDDGGTETTNPAEFRERADATCEEFFGTLFTTFIEALDPTTGEVDPEREDEVAEEVTTQGDAMLAELRDIGAPEGQVEEWEEWIGLMEESLDEVREDPIALLAEEEPRNPERSDRIDELVEELGVPACSGDEVPEVDEQAMPAFARFMAQTIQAESGGIIDDAEAACIADGVTEEFSFAELAGGGDDLFEDLPPDRQAAFMEIIIGCLPAEKLMQLGDL
jgi:AcrR family transcriptional regulator